MKKYLVAGFLLSSLVALGAEYSVNFGIDPYRKTEIAGNREDANGGASLGGEAMFGGEKFTYGLGLELRTMSANVKSEDFYSHPMYGALKYKVVDDYYILGRLGKVFNTNRDITESTGNYFAFGLGKSVGNFDFELIHEASEIKNNDNDSNLKNSLGLYEDGNFETISLKAAYVFGRVKDVIGPEVSLASKVEGNGITWTYGVTERKAKVTQTYLNGKAVPVEADGTYEVKGLPTGRYALEVVAVDKKGNMSRKTDSVILVDNNDTTVKKELEEFVAGERSLPIIVGYEANVTELTPIQKKRLQDGVFVLDGLKGTLSVVGYTDDTGTEEINLNLSKERASEVATLVKKVVKNPEDITIKTVGRGETNFKVANDTEENRKLNRRIEFEFKAENGETITTEELSEVKK